ncbi:tRNA dihydrouridine synthase DusB [Nanchangia anserum]|uniref:tRNA dihydrouridine synthase DusB n=2 Tax=Nanchangia anserum TaxID=2692125 RepID=A0A8I0KR47_9ACTO|nr:tRNA dihydrouridine synthase DusB [Nanchangia anserum]QOX82626.1 tRNA dihydrouridine synthase DusB [Nanchangia anserum]
MRLGPIGLGTPMVLAPMAAVTNAPFRRACRSHALRALAELGRDTHASPTWAPAGLYVCEMITARALVEDRESTWRLVAADPDETPRSVQLHGVDPATMGEAARLLVSRGLAHHVDINFGCPVPKITRKGGGSALPWKTSRFVAIIEAVIAGARAGSEQAGLGFIAPVSVKIRSGIDDDHRVDIDAGLAAQDAGAAAVCLHARTTAEYYSGSAHWDHIGALVEVLDIPVLGNGDIGSAEDALAMRDETGCAGVEVGRGAQGRPWIFADIAHALAGSPRRSRPSSDEVIDMIRTHARDLAQWGGDEGHAMRDLRKHLGWYLRGFRVGGDVKRRLARVGSLAELDDILGEIEPAQPYPAAAEGLHGRTGHSRRPKLPEGWLDTREVDAQAMAVLERAALEGEFSY